MLGPGRGCEAATQFVGEIPPGRAPEHSHPYDEMVLVLEGEGVAHVRGPAVTGRWPPEPGCTCRRDGRTAWRTPGPATLVVLGVFHPGGSPAAEAGLMARDL